jgi:hypothetical protein
MKFRKKPIIIEAMQTDGTVKTANTIREWSNDQLRDHWCGKGQVAFSVQTLEGLMLASPGDWIIRGVRGEYYPCKPEIFAATYDPVED